MIRLIFGYTDSGGKGALKNLVSRPRSEAPLEVDHGNAEGLIEVDRQDSPGRTPVGRAPRPISPLGRRLLTSQPSPIYLAQPLTWLSVRLHHGLHAGDMGHPDRRDVALLRAT